MDFFPEIWGMTNMMFVGVQATCLNILWFWTSILDSGRFLDDLRFLLRCGPRNWHSTVTIGGGFRYFLIFTPIWGRFPFWLLFFQMGWNHQPSNLFFFWKISLIELADLQSSRSSELRGTYRFHFQYNYPMECFEVDVDKIHYLQEETEFKIQRWWNCMRF